MDTDMDGRPLRKGLFAFRNTDRQAALPEEYLFDYLCAFVEEAYEHEKREPEHRVLTAEERLSHCANAVMAELVQTIPSNPNLMRACKRYNCTADTIAALLVAKGLSMPDADSHNSVVGNSAMGANFDAPSGMEIDGAEMAYSMQTPWLQSEPAAAIGVPLHKGPVDDVRDRLVDDYIDPAAALHMRKSAEHRRLWGQGDPVARANVAGDCPIHGGRDITKAANLANPMLPCRCGTARG